MSDRYLEKSLLWLAALSLVLHAAVFALFWYLPAKEPPPPREPVFVDLQNLPDVQQPAAVKRPEAPRLSDRQMRAERETAPRGNAAHDSRTSPQPVAPRPAPPSPAVRPSMPSPGGRSPAPIAPGESVTSLLRRKPSAAPSAPAQPQLFPSASRLARLEETYRRRFESDIAEGDTRFLNSDDILFGSFLRRFEGAVYGVWRYPQEAAMRGIEGVTPVRITFNRRGEIVNVQLLESSGARILDDEVLRTLRAIGPVGSFPRGYDKDEFHLIAFFQYGGTRRSLR